MLLFLDLQLTLVWSQSQRKIISIRVFSLQLPTLPIFQILKKIRKKERKFQKKIRAQWSARGICASLSSQYLSLKENDRMYSLGQALTHEKQYVFSVSQSRLSDSEWYQYGIYILVGQCSIFESASSHIFVQQKKLLCGIVGRMIMRWQQQYFIEQWRHQRPLTAKIGNTKIAFFHMSTAPFMNTYFFPSSKAIMRTTFFFYQKLQLIRKKEKKMKFNNMVL